MRSPPVCYIWSSMLLAHSRIAVFPLLLITAANLLGARAAAAASPASASYLIFDQRIGPGSGAQSGATQYVIPCGGILPGEGRAASKNYVLWSGCGATEKAIAGVNDPQQPVTFRVLPIAPNPFSYSAKIQYRIPQAGSVTAEIFDPLGRLVRTLHARAESPGWHTLAWDGRDQHGHVVKVGVYLIRFSTERERVVRRVVRVE